MNLIGKQFFISYVRENKDVIFRALISKNTRAGEKPFRLTWFKICGGDEWMSQNGRVRNSFYLKPGGHIDFKTKNVEVIRKRLEKTFNSNSIGFPPTNFQIKMNF